MPNGQDIDFRFSIGSTYTYLSVMRLPEIERAAGMTFNWRPFSVRPIMIEQNNRPFIGKPVKTAYMWRDIERRAGRYGLPIRVPAPCPLQEFERANRVAVHGRQEGWCAGYARATYRRWFQEGQEPGSEPNLSDSLRETGQNPAWVITRAEGDEIGSALQKAVDEARALGIFGSPNFVIGGEVFWGDDRLDDALAWLKQRA